MPPGPLQPAFPEDLAPETLLYSSFKTGHHFASYDAFFDHLTACKFPAPAGKPKQKGATEHIVWHERNLPKAVIPSSNQFDFHLQLAILYLVPLTPSRSLDQLVDTLTEYLRRRFIKGEQILFKRHNKWEPGTICGVRYNGPVLDELSLDGTRYIPRDFAYDVKPLDISPDDDIIADITCKQLRRQAFDRGSIRSCILQHCKCREPRKTSSLWSLKKKTILAYDLNNLSWLDMSAAKEPRFTVQAKSSKNFPRKDKNDRTSSSKDRSKKSQGKDKKLGKGRKASEASKERSSKKRKRDDSEDLHSSKSKKSKSTSSFDGKGKGEGRTTLSSAERAEIKKLKQQEYKKRWREKMKQDREKLTNVWAKVFSVGEDMECPSLKPIPIVPQPLETLMPEKFIADGLFVMEFLRVFGNSVDKSGVFADVTSMDLDRLYTIVSSESVDGELTQLLAFCCRAVLSTVPQQPVEKESSVIYNSGFQQEGANVISSTISRLGVSLHDLSISTATVSEVVRLTLLVACVPVRASAMEARYDGAILRMLKSPGGSSLYGVIYGQSVFALSFEKRLELIVQMLQSVMESDVVRGVLEEACAGVEDKEKALKALKSLNDEAAKIKGKILVSKDREDDRKDQKNDRFRHLLDWYGRKRSLRALEAGGQSAMELMENFRILNEGRKRRRLTEQDVASLKEAFEDYRHKIGEQIQAEREVMTAGVKRHEQQFRLEALGLDRHWFKYWLIPSINGLLIECTAREVIQQCSPGCLCQTIKAHQEQAKSCSTWWTLGNGEEDSIMVLSKHLLVGGEREVALKRALEPYLQQAERKSLEIGKQQSTTLRPAGATAPIPQLAPAEVWQQQLRDHLLATLCHFNHNLQKARLGGIPVEKEGAWLENMKGTRPVVQEEEEEEEELVAAASPEIMEPARNDDDKRRHSVVEEEGAGLVNGHCTLVTDEADKEPDQASTNDLKPHLMSPKLVKKQQQQRQQLQDWPPPEVEEDEVEESGSPVGSSVEQPAVCNGSGLASVRPFDSQTTALVKRLVLGINQLLSHLSLRYVGKPLVTIDDGEEKQVEQFERWKRSLASCAFSLSEVAVHLSVLHSSILWNKSTLNANCKACRKRGDMTNIACCDRCERKFHLDCVIPPLQEIPLEWWVCPICQPVPIFRSSRKARQTPIDYNDDKLPPTLPHNRHNHQDLHPSSLNGHKASSRTSRPPHAYPKEDTEEEEENAQQHEGEEEASRRRSGRGKRVDYKELAEGTSPHPAPQAPSSPLDHHPQPDLDHQDGHQPETTVHDYEDQLAEEEEDYETAASPLQSEDSEYDPDDYQRPKWGKTHRKNNRK